MSNQNGQKKNITCPKMIKLKRKKSIFIKDMNKLREAVSQYWLNTQSSLFPYNIPKTPALLDRLETELTSAPTHDSRVAIPLAKMSDVDDISSD